MPKKCVPTEAGESAFPLPEGEKNQHSWGMDMREWYAEQALAGLLVHYRDPSQKDEVSDIAQTAFILADAMLAQAAKPQEDKPPQET